LEELINNLDNIIDKIEKEIDEKNKVKEHVLRLSRSIVINCRKSIQKMHQNQFDEAIHLIQVSSALISELYDTSEKFPDISSAGYAENASQEYVEANCLYQILQGKDLLDPIQLHTSNTAYLTGLCDVVGELRRKALDMMLNGKFESAHGILDIMEDIYDAILRFDYPSSLVPIKRKQDVLRTLIEKTRGELAIASVGDRIESKTEEFKVFVDSLKSNSK
jgi:translin